MKCLTEKKKYREAGAVTDMTKGHRFLRKIKNEEAQPITHEMKCSAGVHPWVCFSSNRPTLHTEGYNTPFTVPPPPTKLTIATVNVCRFISFVAIPLEIYGRYGNVCEANVSVRPAQEVGGG